MVASIRKSLVMGLVSASLLGAAPLVMAADWKVDPVHSHVVFRIKHLGASWSYGMFHGPVGTLTFNPDSPESSKLVVRVPAKSIDTGNQKRDAHLLSNDYFAAEQFPAIEFTSTGFTKISDTEYEVAGELKLRGQARPITVKLVKTGEGKTPDGVEVAGFETTFTIKRTDFGMDAMVGPLGDEVHLTVSLEVAKQ